MPAIRTPNGEFTQVFKGLFETFSTLDYADRLQTDAKLTQYVQTINRKYRKEPLVITDNARIQPKAIQADNRVLIALSGGKDSLASALKLQQQGYEVEFYHVLGINRSYTNEWKASKRIANKLGREIGFAKVIQEGRGDFAENPTKNALILAMMVDYGLRKGITKYSMGSALDGTLDTLNKMNSLSDAVELYQMLEEYYQTYIPAFKLLNTIQNEKESYQVILEADADLLKYTSSCMAPYRFQKNLRRQNSAKYGMLFTKGCGASCYKCAHELLTLDKAGIQPITPDVRAKCIQLLKEFDGVRYSLDTWI